MSTGQHVAHEARATFDLPWSKLQTSNKSVYTSEDGAIHDEKSTDLCHHTDVIRICPRNGYQSLRATQNWKNSSPMPAA